MGPFEKVRTSARALARLEELAVEAAGDAEVDVAVAHLASPDRAAQLAERLADRLETGWGAAGLACGEIGAVLGAHVGPGMVAVCVSRAQPEPSTTAGVDAVLHRPELRSSRRAPSRS